MCTHTHTHTHAPDNASASSRYSYLRIICISRPRLAVTTSFGPPRSVRPVNENCSRIFLFPHFRNNVTDKLGTCYYILLERRSLYSYVHYAATSGASIVTETPVVQYDQSESYSSSTRSDVYDVRKLTILKITIFIRVS